jgi:hypothetical protein
MTIRPESGPEYGQELWEKPAPPPTELEEEERELYGGERELYEREAGERDRDRAYADPEDNELHVPGQACERCGMAITAMQEARRLPDGRWIHEVCPVHPS